MKAKDLFGRVCLLLLAVAGLTACGNKEEFGLLPPVEWQAEPYEFPTLGASQTEGNIFDPIQFRLQTGNSFMKQDELEDLCDSIVWTLKGEPGSFRVFEKEESPGVSGSRLCLSWTHCFTLPGRYEAHLTAWKDNAPLIDSCLELNITDGKDFLLFNWQDITDNAKGWTGHANVLDEHCRFITNYGQEEGTPFMQLRIFEAAPSDSYTLLHDYFCRLYGEPAYGSRTVRQQMFDLYTELFSGHKLYPDASPLHIWLTERARVVLLQLEDWAKGADYVAYAEPLR